MRKVLLILLAPILAFGCSSPELTEWKRLCTEMKWTSCDAKPSIVQIRENVFPLTLAHSDLSRAVLTLNEKIGHRVIKPDLAEIQTVNAFRITKTDGLFTPDFLDKRVKVERLVIYPPRCFGPGPKTEIEECRTSEIYTLGAQIKIDRSTLAGKRLLADLNSQQLPRVCGVNLLGHLRLVERRNERGESLGRIGWWTVERYSPAPCETKFLAEVLARQVSSVVFRKIITARQSSDIEGVYWPNFISSEISARLSQATSDIGIARSATTESEASGDSERMIAKVTSRTYKTVADFEDAIKTAKKIGNNDQYNMLVRQRNELQDAIKQGLVDENGNTKK